VNDYPEFDAFKERHLDERRIDSPLMALCLSLLREDKARERAKKAQGKLPPVDPRTGQLHTRWDDLSDDMKTYGDKYVSTCIDNQFKLFYWIHTKIKKNSNLFAFNSSITGKTETSH
jgi:hypothetical protein